MVGDFLRRLLRYKSSSGQSYLAHSIMSSNVSRTALSSSIHGREIDLVHHFSCISAGTAMTFGHFKTKCARIISLSTPLKRRLYQR